MACLLAGCTVYPTGKQSFQVQSRVSVEAVAQREAATLYVTRLAWTQLDACAGWCVFGYSNNVPVLVTNIPRPFYGFTFTNTIASPFAFNTIRAYTR